MLSLPLHASAASSQNFSCLLQSLSTFTILFLLLSANNAMILSMLNFPAGINGLILINFPVRLCAFWSRTHSPPPP